MEPETAARMLCAYFKRMYEAAGLRWNHMNEAEVRTALLAIARPIEPDPEEPDEDAVARRIMSGVGHA